MNKRNWSRRLPCLGISAFFLLGSSAVYADTLRHPQMSLIQDGFNTQQKLNLTIYNPNIKLTHQGEFTSPMGFYVYTNYPTKIAHYQIAIYRLSDTDNLNALKTFRFNEISPYEAILWNGETDNGELLLIDSDYKVILTAVSDKGLKDEVYAATFKTLGYGQTEESDFIAYTRATLGWKRQSPNPE